MDALDFDLDDWGLNLDWDGLLANITRRNSTLNQNETTSEDEAIEFSFPSNETQVFYSKPHTKS